MSYFEKIQIQAADSPTIDAFARLRVAAPKTIFDSKLTFSGSLSAQWSIRTWGNATSSYSPYGSKTIMTVGTESGSRVIEQTKQWFVYEPGKSLSIILTGVLGDGENGISKYIMYGNDDSGLGFCQSGSSLGLIIRDRPDDTTITTTFISQSEWNLDRFDGNGPSGKTLDPHYAQIYIIDMEWLGVGRVRYGVYQGGIPYYIHELSHINTLISPYMGNPNLPVRYEIVNNIGSAQTSSMRHICCSIISEGGTDNIGIVNAVDTKDSPVTIGASSHAGILYLRHISGSAINVYRGNAGKLSPIGLDIWGNANVGLRWSLLVNPTIANFDTLTWTKSGILAAEYATGSTATTVTTQGELLASGYIPASTNQVKSSANILLDPFFALGEDLFGNRDYLVLSAWTLGGTICPTYASLLFRENV